MTACPSPKLEHQVTQVMAFASKSDSQPSIEQSKTMCTPLKTYYKRCTLKLQLNDCFSAMPSLITLQIQFWWWICLANAWSLCSSWNHHGPNVVWWSGSRYLVCRRTALCEYLILHYLHVWQQPWQARRALTVRPACSLAFTLWLMYGSSLHTHCCCV